MLLFPSNTRILTIAGLDNSGPAHWQSLWEQKLDNIERIDLGNWFHPVRDQWIANIAHHIAGEEAPLYIAAHSLGCHAFSHWYANAPSSDRAKIAGTLLVAPPDLGRLSKLSRVQGFETIASFSSPSPMIVVGSDNDPYAQLAHVWRLSRHWDARFENAGPFGHINADSNIGDWPYGLYLLASLIVSQEPALGRRQAMALPRESLHRLRSRNQGHEI